MSRSQKKHPITTVAKCSNGMKHWKKNCNRHLRRSTEDIPNGSAYRKFSGDVWDSPGDGKVWLDGDKWFRK